MPKTTQLNIKPGFTLIELLVSISIVAIIATISVANFRNGEKQKRVGLAAEGIITAIRTAQNYTQTSKEISQSTCANKAAKAYRIVFTPANQYNLLVDDNCSNAFQLETYTLPINTQINSSGLTLNNASVNRLEFKFTPPFAVLTASSDGASFATFTSARIRVELTDGSINKSVNIDGISGRIGE